MCVCPKLFERGVRSWALFKGAVPRHERQTGLMVNPAQRATYADLRTPGRPPKTERGQGLCGALHAALRMCWTVPPWLNTRLLILPRSSNGRRHLEHCRDKALHFIEPKGQKLSSTRVYGSHQSIVPYAPSTPYATNFFFNARKQDVAIKAPLTASLRIDASR